MNICTAIKMEIMMVGDRVNEGSDYSMVLAGAAAHPGVSSN
jgi:hypothetical protein